MQTESSDPPAQIPAQSAEWWLVRCPSCRTVLRIQEDDLVTEEVIACSVCQELFRTPELFQDQQLQARRGQLAYAQAEEFSDEALGEEGASEEGVDESVSNSSGLSSKEGKVKRRKKKQQQLNPDRYTRTLEREQRQKAKLKIPSAVLFLLILILGMFLIAALVIWQRGGFGQGKNPANQAPVRIERQPSDVQRSEQLKKQEDQQRGSNQEAEDTEYQELSALERFKQQRESQFQGELSTLELEALALVDEFLSTTSAEQRLSFANKDGQEQQGRFFKSLERFLRSGQAPDGLGSYQSVVTTSLQEQPNPTSVRLLDGQARAFRFVAVESWGKAKLDLPASFAVGEVSWSELSRASGEKLMRVVIEPSDYYNFEFRDNQQWKAWRLSHPHESQQYYAYSEIGSAVHQQMMQALEIQQRTLAGMAGERGPEQRQRWTLRLAINEESAQRGQFLIQELASESWVFDD